MPILKSLLLFLLIFSDFCIAFDQVNISVGSSLASGVESDYSLLSQSSSYLMSTDYAHSLDNKKWSINFAVGYQYSKYLRNSQNLELGNNFSSSYLFAKVGIGYILELSDKMELFLAPAIGIGRFIFRNDATNTKIKSYPMIACGALGARYFFTDTSNGVYGLYSLEFQKIFVDSFTYEKEVIKSSEFEEDIKIVIGLGRRF